MTAHELARAIEALARRQHGAFNRTQARDLGASASLIDRRLLSGAWIRLAPSVYALPGNPPTFERQCMAATLGEPMAWISGPTAAVLHGLDGSRPGRIEITVPPGASHRRSLAVVRRSATFDATKVDSIPVGTVEQTICDLACSVSEARLADIVDSTLSSKRTTVVRLAARFEALPSGTRNRMVALRRILGDRSADAFVPPTTKLEGVLYRVLDHSLLPPYKRQPALPWRPDAPQRADSLITSWGLFVEADGRAWHSRVADFERDRRRDRDALAHGYEVARYVYDELVSDPRSVVDDLLRIGDARGRLFMA
jgi:very-short-patch-repair endonuclease